MKWILIISVVIIITFFYFHFTGNPKFWKYVRKYPIKAHKFFKNNDCWMIIYPNDIKSPPNVNEWSGPYKVFLPEIGYVKVYGRVNHFEKNQQEFVNEIEMKI